MSRTIFITEASRGFGKLWSEAFLKHGDKVAATARNLSALDDLVEDYNSVREAFAKSGENSDALGKPEATVEAILKVVDSQNPPQRLLLGKIAYHAIQDVYSNRLKEIEEWKEVSIAAHGH
ncbi:hypothetical protein [uncultured Flavobacterium sp.]|uniref:hypothetical protein n=1 Tax=uncultured Flavobacterium sp. TaxID=165435 RepID=UPI0025E80166|nr:hypothetical protein [uncultured Flavobacterium sp.]